MGVEHDDLVGVSEEADFLLGHLDGAVVHGGHLFDGLLEFVGAEFDLRVAHLDGHQLLGLRIEFVLLAVEVIEAVADVGAFDLLAGKVLNFRGGLADVFAAKSDQTEMLLEVLLLAVNARLLHLEGLRILQLHLRLLE